MRRHFRIMRSALSAVMVGGISATTMVAEAQYPQYPAPGYATPPQQQQQYQYPPGTQPAVYPQTQPVQQPYAPAYVPPTGYAAQPYATQPTATQPPMGTTPRVAMMQGTPPQPNDLPLPSEPVPAAPSQSTPYPSTGYPAAGDCGCNGQQTWAGYMQSGVASGCNSGCDVGADLCAPPRSRQWFLGVYGLFMDMDNSSYRKLTVGVDSPSSYPYYPPNDRTILSSANADTDWMWGAEIRFGSTFGCAQTCGCQTHQPFAWEVAYWGLAEDEQQSTVWDELGDTDRFYGMVNFAGLEYDRDGAGGMYDYRPVNDYYDYQMPIEDPADPNTNEVRVLAQRVRSSFSAQNLELNFIRFPLCSYGSCCGSSCGCDPCGCNSCGPVAPRFSMNGICGFRYLRFDNDFQYASYFSNYPTIPDDPQSYPGGFPLDDDNSLYYDVSLDNELAGFQLGASMCWNVTCRISAFWDTTFGLYNNHINSYQRLYNGSGGVVRFQGTGQNFSVNSSKDDLAFLGEMRLGVGYQVSCNWRLTAAYRIIGIGGVAMAVDQIPTDFSNWEYVALIDSNDALFLHGAQFGAEMKY